MGVVCEDEEVEVVCFVLVFVVFEVVEWLFECVGD